MIATAQATSSATVESDMVASATVDSAMVESATVESAYGGFDNSGVGNDRVVYGGVGYGGFYNGEVGNGRFDNGGVGHWRSSQPRWSLATVEFRNGVS